jgi:murein DD-endopeptidase MepM/ murein hydrolase activator NlpD
MRKGKICGITILLVLLVVGAWFFGFGPGRMLFYSYDLERGQSPELSIPFTDASHLHIIQGFGQVSAENYHNGIDWGFNDTTMIIAAFGGYIIDVKTWFNEKGGHWQTNVRSALNLEWIIEIAFESWALNETYANYQAAEILVKTGQKVTLGQNLGNLVNYGEGTHIHFSLYQINEAVCPYSYFTDAAKLTFDDQYAHFNSSHTESSPCLYS